MAWLCSLLYPIAFSPFNCVQLRRNCLKAVSGLRRETRALSQRDLGFSVSESSNVTPSVPYFWQTGRKMDNFGTGGLVRRQHKGKEKCAAVETARLPHTHTPRKSKIAGIAACYFLFLTLRAWIRAFSSVPRGSRLSPDSAETGRLPSGGNAAP